MATMNVECSFRAGQGEEEEEEETRGLGGEAVMLYRQAVQLISLRWHTGWGL